MNNHTRDILNHEKTLYVIKELEQNPTLTQRDLAKRLDVSLGRVNFLINSLIDKGIIEAKNFKNSKNKLAYMYLLTPEGIKVKLQLTSQFIVWKTHEYERLRQELRMLEKDISGLGVTSEEAAASPGVSRVRQNDAVADKVGL